MSHAAVPGSVVSTQHAARGSEAHRPQRFKAEHGRVVGGAVDIVQLVQLHKCFDLLPVAVAEFEGVAVEHCLDQPLGCLHVPVLQEEADRIAHWLRTPFVQECCEQEQVGCHKEAPCLHMCTCR